MLVSESAAARPWLLHTHLSLCVCGWALMALRLQVARDAETARPRRRDVEEDGQDGLAASDRASRSALFAARTLAHYVNGVRCGCSLPSREQPHVDPEHSGDKCEAAPARASVTSPHGRNCCFA